MSESPHSTVRPKLSSMNHSIRHSQGNNTRLDATVVNSKLEKLSEEAAFPLTGSEQSCLQEEPL